MPDWYPVGADLAMAGGEDGSAERLARRRCEHVFLCQVVIQAIGTVGCRGMSETSVITVALIEDNRLVREGLAALLGRFEDFRVVDAG